MRAYLRNLILSIVVSVPVSNAFVIAMMALEKQPLVFDELFWSSLVTWGPSLFTAVVVIPLSCLLTPFVDIVVPPSSSFPIVRGMLTLAVMALLSTALWYLADPYPWPEGALPVIVGTASYGALVGYMQKRQRMVSRPPAQ